jgi:hypothetical protein
MKSSLKPHGITFLACLWLAGAWGAAPELAPKGQPVRYVIGLSPFLDRSVKDDVYRRIVGFLIEDVPLNSSLWLYDAYHLRTITEMEVPEVRAFRSPKTRANQFKEPVLKLKEFLAAEHEKPAGSKVPLDQAVRFPQFMDFVGANLAGAGHGVVVIILGNPLYLDPKEPGFSMVDGFFPSDGHLQATREQSIFGLKNRAGALQDLVVHFGYFGDPWVSEVHQEKIMRFWSLYLQGQGARLATFCGDLPTVFNAARVNSPVAMAGTQRYAVDPAQSKIEMLRMTREVGLADWITRDVLPNTPLPPPSTLVGPMKIGIRWKDRIDLDLYASPNDHAETLYFEHTRSPDGYYNKDYRSSPEHEYEFIEFQTPVDVRQVEAMVNFYKGNAPGGPAGEVRIEFDGRIYSGRFSIEADHGNEGRSGGNQGKFWARLNVPKILKLPEIHVDASLSNFPR